MKLTVKDGAQWTPTAIASTDTTAQTGQKDTPLNNLVLDNGIVNVKDETVQVKIEQLSGSGTVRLATDLTADEGQQAGQKGLRKIHIQTVLQIIIEFYVLFSTVVFSPRHSSRKRGSAHLA